MINKLKFIAAGLAAFCLLAAPALVPAEVFAQNEIQSGLTCGSEFDVSSATSGTANCVPADGEDPGERLNGIIRLVINIFSLVVGVVAVIMIIIGGLKYITSGGDSGNVTSAKNTILYAIIGLVIVALAQFIVRFVLSRVTS